MTWARPRQMMGEFNDKLGLWDAVHHELVGTLVGEGGFT